MSPTDKKAAVCLSQNLKTRHIYHETCNLRKVELNTTSKL
jgi:hypothetical protein